MDERVKQAMAKWPNVPSCTGWLALDRRGVWRMRDEAAQQTGAAGAPIRHAALNDFINRNYAADKAGCWFFQNGPQRVYIELAYTPWVVRLQLENGDLRLIDQTGADFEPRVGWLDDAGSVLFSDDAQRIALLHDHDLDLFSEHANLSSDGESEPVSSTAARTDDSPHSGTFVWRKDQVLPLKPIHTANVPEQFHFVCSPAATHLADTAHGTDPAQNDVKTT